MLFLSFEALEEEGELLLADRTRLALSRLTGTGLGRPAVIRDRAAQVAHAFAVVARLPPTALPTGTATSVISTEEALALRCAAESVVQTDLFQLTLTA